MMHFLKTEPAAEPVTLAEMRQHLGISQSSDTSRDSIITGRIVSARSWTEDFTRRSLITQTWQGYATHFPWAYSCDKHYFRGFALRHKLQSVTSIKWVDIDGNQQTLNPVLYSVDLNSGMVLPAYGTQWPISRIWVNAVEIEYICGYGSAAADVPEPIKEAIRFIVGQWEVFQSSIEGVVRPFTIPNAAKELLNNYIDMRNYFNDEA